MILIYRSFNEYRRADLVTVVRYRRRARRNGRYFSASCVSLRGTVRLSTATSVIPCLFRRPFLHAHRLREGVLYVGYVRRVSRFFGSMSAVPFLPIFNVSRGIWLGVGRFFGFGAMLYPARSIEVN